MRVTIVLLAGLLAGLTLSCGSELATSQTAVEPEPALVVVSLQFQDVTLRVESDERFTLVDDQNVVLAEHVTLDELWAIAPEVAQGFEQAVAGPIDASLGPELLESSSGWDGPAAP